MSSNSLNEVKLWASSKEQEKYENLAGAPVGASTRSACMLRRSLAMQPNLTTTSSPPSPPHHPPDLFAIIKATEKLERAYVRDDVTAGDYEGACEKLIAQFKVLWGSMRDAVGGGAAAAAVLGCGRVYLI
jgi:hypothetical protein